MSYEIGSLIPKKIEERMTFLYTMFLCYMVRSLHYWNYFHFLILHGFLINRKTVIALSFLNIRNKGKCQVGPSLEGTTKPLVQAWCEDRGFQEDSLMNAAVSCNMVLNIFSWKDIRSTLSCPILWPMLLWLLSESHKC